VVVVPDRGRESKDSLQYADGHAARSAASVAFEAMILRCCAGVISGQTPP
jgi:hypothetical protein